MREEGAAADAGGYIEEAIKLRAGEDDATNGILTLPEGEGPFPAVVMVHGSGPSDMDESAYACAPFRDIAHGLARLGVASIRYDKYTYAHPENCAWRGLYRGRRIHARRARRRGAAHGGRAHRGYLSPRPQPGRDARPAHHGRDADRSRRAPARRRAAGRFAPAHVGDTVSSKPRRAQNAQRRGACPERGSGRSGSGQSDRVGGYAGRGTAKTDLLRDKRLLSGGRDVRRRRADRGRSGSAAVYRPGGKGLAGAPRGWRRGLAGQTSAGL